MIVGGDAPTPLYTERPQALWDSTVCWFRYPSCIKQFINDFSGGEIAGNPIPATPSGLISTLASAIKDSKCYFDCIERSYPWLGHTFAVCKDFINDFSGGEIAGNPSPIPATPSGLISTPASAIKDSKYYFNCIEWSHPWLGHTFAVCKNFIKDFSGGEMAGNPTTAAASTPSGSPSAQPMSTRSSALALKDSTCYLDCIERSHPWLGHTFAEPEVDDLDTISLKSDGRRIQSSCTSISGSSSRERFLPSRNNRL